MRVGESLAVVIMLLLLIVLLLTIVILGVILWSLVSVLCPLVPVLREMVVRYFESGKEILPEEMRKKPEWGDDKKDVEFAAKREEDEIYSPGQYGDAEGSQRMLVGEDDGFYSRSTVQACADDDMREWYVKPGRKDDVKRHGKMPQNQIPEDTICLDGDAADREFQESDMDDMDGVNVEIKVALENLEKVRRMGSKARLEESLHGEMIIVLQKGNDFYAEPVEEIINERDYECTALKSCFNVKPNVESGYSYKVNIMESCVLRKEGAYYYVKKKGLLQIEKEF